MFSRLLINVLIHSIVSFINRLLITMELKQTLEKNVYFLIFCRIVSNSNLIDEIAAKGKLSKIFQLDNPDTGLKIRIFSKYSD